MHRSLQNFRDQKSTGMKELGRKKGGGIAKGSNQCRYSILSGWIEDEIQEE
jgi:ribosomal protein L19E